MEDAVPKPKGLAALGRIRESIFQWRSKSPRNRQDYVRVLSWVGFVLAFCICPLQRYKFVFRLNPPKNFVWSDMAGYVDRAWRLSQPDVVLNRFDAFYPPGTHVLMAPLFRLAGNRDAGIAANQWLWWVLAVLTVWAVGLIGLKLFKHPLAGAVAMTSLLVYWTFTAFTGFFLSENPFSCFMALTLLVGLIAADRVGKSRVGAVVLFALVGLLGGITMTIRPQFASNIAILGLPLLLRRRPFVRVPEAIAVAAFTLIPVVGALALQRHAAGKPVGLSGNAGFNFYQAHCDVVHVETRQGGSSMGFAAPVTIQRMIKEGRDPNKKIIIYDHMAWDNEFFFAEGMKCVRADGIGHVRRLSTSVADMFATTDPWPPNMGKHAKRTNLGNVVYCWGLLVVTPFALWLAWRRRPERWLILQLGTVFPVALLFVGDPRYRVPYDMFGFLLLGGILAAALGARGDARTDRAEPEKAAPLAEPEVVAPADSEPSSDERPPAAESNDRDRAAASVAMVHEPEP